MPKHSEEKGPKIHWPKIHWPRIHWIGAGLASGPGILSLVEKWGDINVWDIELQKADSLKKYLTEESSLNTHILNLEDAKSRKNFTEHLKKGDIIISMLPAAFHVKVAKLALAHNCHMVTSSYLSEEMLALNDEAKSKGLSLVNEVGLDPGIDHLLAQILVDNARKKGLLGQGYAIDFTSYCGGFPVKETPFTYKFSWTPLGVLTALTNTARMIRDGQEHTVNTAWEEITELSLDNRIFEGYANRDSLPYIAEYGLEGEKNLRNFVRGTLRLSGWKKAWKDIFSRITNSTDQDLKDLSDQLWHDHQYEEGEQDRVVLHVALSITPTNGTAWNSSLSLDVTGGGWQSAMAKTVSYTASEAVNALMEGRLTSGVQGAPHDIYEAKIWLKGLAENGITIKRLENGITIKRL